MSLYKVAVIFTNVLAHIFFNIKYENIENIPTDQGFIVASNHTTNFDPIFLAPKLPTEMHFMAKEELYKTKLLSWLFRHLNAFPVKRGSADMTSLHHAQQIIADGGVLCLFPEGTRSKDKNPGRAKPGIAMIAAQVKCGILPVGISYKGKLGFRKKITLRFGKFIFYDELDIVEDSSSSVRKAAIYVMKRVVDEMDKDCYDSEKNAD